MEWILLLPVGLIMPWFKFLLLLGAAWVAFWGLAYLLASEDV